MDRNLACAIPERALRARRRRRIARWARRGLFVGLAAGILALVVTGLLPDPVAVEIATAHRAPLTVTVDEDGRTRVKDRYLVSAPIDGLVTRIELEPGDVVEAGEVVARIIPLVAPLLDARARLAAEARVAAALSARKQAAAGVERAKAALRFAEADAARLERLLAEEVIAARELEQARFSKRAAAAELASARFAYEVAEHELETARAALHRLQPGAEVGEQIEVTAPVAGRVLEVHRKSEGAVQVGTPFVEVGDPGALEVVVDVLTPDAVAIPEGARVVLDRWGGPALEGRVRRAEPSAFTRVSALGVEEQRVNVLVDLVDDRGVGRLGDGYRVEAHIVVWESADALSVPSSAVFRGKRGFSVYRVEAGIARATVVSVGQRTGRRVEILSGLAAGDAVIVHPSDAVEDGVAVRAR